MLLRRLMNAQIQTKAVAVLFLLCSLVGSTAAATLTFPLTESTNWNLIVTLDGSESAASTGSGRIQYPADGNGQTYNEISFQGEGAMQMSIRPEYMGADQSGTNQLSVSFAGGGMSPAFAPNGAMTSVASFNGKDIYGFNDPNGGFSNYFWLYVKCTHTASGSAFPEEVTARLRVNVIKLRHIFIAPIGKSFRWMVGGSDLQIKNDGTIERKPIDGESLHIQTAQPVDISPADPVLSKRPLIGGLGDYPYGSAEILLEASLDNFSQGQALPVVVDVSLGNAPTFSMTLYLQYAIVESFGGTVDRYNVLTAQWDYVGASGWNLQVGDRLRCTTTVSGSSVIYPWVNFRFASGHNYLVELTNNDFNQSYYATITMGPNGGFSKSGVAMTTALSQDFNDAKFATQNFIREWAWDKTLSSPGERAIQLLAPGSGWLLSTLGGEASKLLIQSGIDAMGGGRSTPVPPALNVIGEVSAPLTTGSSALSSLPPGGSSVLSADRVTSVRGDKSVQIDSLNTITAVTVGSRTVVLPPGGRIVATTSAAGTSLGPASLGGASQFGYGVTGGIVISPGDGQTVSSRTPQLTVTLTGSQAYRPDTLVARVNGIALPGIQDRTVGSMLPTFVIPIPKSMPLKPGTNHVEVGCFDANFGWTTAQAWINAPAAGPDPLSHGPTVYSSPDALMFAWSASAFSGLEGYKIYAGTTLDNMVVVNPGNVLLPQAIALLRKSDFPAIATPLYYAISVVADGIESAKSPAVLATLGAVAPNAPQPLSSLNIAQAQDGLMVSFNPATGAIGYQVERNMNNAGWQAWPYPGAIFSGPFLDKSVSVGANYAYRLTPVSSSVAAGQPTASAAQTAIDLPPPAPTGLVAYQRYYGDKYMNITLEWDKPQQADVTAHTIWVKRNQGSWQRLYKLVGDTSQFVYSIPTPGAYAFVVTAHDIAGQESVASAMVGGGLGGRGDTSLSAILMLLLD